MSSSGQIIAIGSGRSVIADTNNPLHQYILDLCDTKSPSLGFLPTASGDDARYIELFYKTYQAYSCQIDHLPLFYRTESNLSPWFDRQEVIYVGGGNTANMLAVWRLHGVDLLLQQFLDRGGIAYGGSAGALCWFEEGITDSFGDNNLSALRDGLSLLPGSLCPHFDSEPGRAPLYQKMITEEQLAPGYGLDDFAALHFVGQDLLCALELAPGSRVQRITRGGAEMIPSKAL